MGNDGGSIPDRRDLVRNKPKAEQADKANQTRARWFFCALSKRPLQEPIVSCPLGKLYNKDALLEFLLDRNAYGDGEDICGHIKSLKDVKTLKLTPNPAPGVPSPTDANYSATMAQFICPLNLKEMNGSQPFVYIVPCGCVMSQAGLKVLTGSSGSTPPLEGETGKEGRNLEVCPQCGTKYDKKDDVRVLNPEPELEADMRVALEARRASKPTKTKKRKAEAVDANSESASKDTEKAKKPKVATPSMNPSIAATSRAVASGLAMEEAKRKAAMSDAVKSLYEGKANKTKETFMTRGTFTRYA